MPRLKKKWTVPAVALKSEPVTPTLPVAYSFDLKAAATYTGFSVWALRIAITSGTLPVVRPKPYIIRRADLERFVDEKLRGRAA